MDFAALERAVYGEQVEDDEELMAELLALEAETAASSAPALPARPPAAPIAPAPVARAPVPPAPVARAPVPPAPVARAPVPPAPVARAPVPPAPVARAPAPPAPVARAPAPPASVARAPAPPASTEERKKAEIRKVLIRRRNAYVENGKAAVACDDKTAAMQYVEVSKMFDEALKLLETASADDLDLNEAPPSPQPYRRKVVPKSFVEGLQYRRELYVAMVEKAKNAGDQRKTRMYSRSVAEYDEAIGLAKSGGTVNISELPSLPNMAPLPPQKSSQTQLPKPAEPSHSTAPNKSPSPKPVAGPPAGIKPPPAVGPLADSGEPGKSRNQTQLEFLLTRQTQFKQAAIAAKKSGNTELAREYLIESKGFEKMINRAKAGLPVTIRDTPIPPQARTGQASLQPRIVASNNSITGLEGRGEVLAMLESTLIEQIKFAETNRMRFTRLGDVGKVNMFENWAKISKTDLLLVREVAKQGLQIPGFRYEIRDVPTADLFPDLAEDVLELTIAECRDVPLPSGYETKHASLFVKYSFPYPTETPQMGKTKTVNDTVSPVFDEKLMIQIGERRARGQRLLRSLKRAALKLEVYQKGSFLRSDKLLGVCEFKLDVLEGKAEVEESAPLKEGRKAVGGLISFKVRIREPLGDTKVLVAKQKWLMLLN